MIRKLAFLFLSACVAGATWIAFPHVDPTMLLPAAALVELALILLVFKPIRVNETDKLQALVESHTTTLAEREKAVNDQLLRMQQQMEDLGQKVEAVSLSSSLPTLVDTLQRMPAVDPAVVANLQVVVNALPQVKALANATLPDAEALAKAGAEIATTIRAMQGILVEAGTIDLDALQASVEKLQAAKDLADTRKRITTIDERLAVFRRVFLYATVSLYNTYNSREFFQQAIHQAFSQIAPEYTWDRILLTDEQWVDFRQNIVRWFNNGSGWKDWGNDSPIAAATARLFIHINPYN